MTEPDALDKICPFTMPDEEKHCRGSKCMSWRWDQVAPPVHEFQKKAIEEGFQRERTGDCLLIVRGRW